MDIEYHEGLIYLLTALRVGDTFYHPSRNKHYMITTKQSGGTRIIDAVNLSTGEITNFSDTDIVHKTSMKLVGKRV